MDPPELEGAERREKREGEGERPRIRLDDFLKLTGCVRSGGEAKHRIQAGEVRVNGAVETRRSRKLHPGDQVLMDGATTVVHIPQEGET